MAAAMNRSPNARAKFATVSRNSYVRRLCSQLIVVSTAISAKKPMAMIASRLMRWDSPECCVE